MSTVSHPLFLALHVAGMCALLSRPAAAAPLAPVAPVAPLASLASLAPRGPFAPPGPFAQLAPAVRPAPDKDYEHALSALLERAFPGAFGFDQGGMAPAGDGKLLRDTLSSPAFLHAAAGPFDVYVFKADGFAATPVAQRTLDAAVKCLTPLAAVVAQRFDHPMGAIGGQRFPLVLASSDPARKQTGFDELIALADWCDAGDWTHDNGTLWNRNLRDALVVRTWRVQLMNLAHHEATSQGEAFFTHGLGYYEIAHLVFRLMRLGSWGLSPPWLDQGLMDELDIEAYGEAWVGGDWYVTQTAGWYRPGWSGFVPQGSAPPQPVTGPPADLATTVSKSGDSWQHRKNSPTRHWDNLVADLTAAFPASFRFMADHESFLPRDRAEARCLMHLLLDLMPEKGTALLAALDHVPTKQENGMFDSEPLPELFARALGGLKDVDALAGQPLRTKLPAIGHKELVDEFITLCGKTAEGAPVADGLLDLADHRAAGEWLYGHPEFDMETRARLFNLILTAEYLEQHALWTPISDALDRAMHAALSASKSFPKDAAARGKVAEAFRAGWSK